LSEPRTKPDSATRNRARSLVCDLARPVLRAAGMRKHPNVSILVASTLLAVAAPAIALAAPPVVGGTLVPAHAYPDAVAVLANDAACSGTLIAPDVVLTAGHCIGVNPVEVIVDTTDYASSGGEHIAVKSAKAYPSWQTEYDVGVIMLAQPAHAKPRAIAAECAIDKDLVDNAKVRLVGFGLTDEGGSGDNSRLHQAMLDVTDAQCTDPEACNTKISPGGEFMAGGDGTDSCFGDSGGPVYLGSGSTAALVGVVSRGFGPNGEPCGGGGVYIRADQVVTWIEKTTGRTLTRSSCSGKADGEGDADTAAAADGGGCAAGGGAAGTGGLVLALGCALRFKRRRRA
jgi:secreted trypsin-like serine protease